MCLLPGGVPALRGVPARGCPLGGMPAPGGVSALGVPAPGRVPGGDPPDGYFCGRYAFYWNAFLFYLSLILNLFTQTYLPSF